MNPHIQTPARVRDRKPLSPSPSRDRDYLLIPRNPLQTRHIRRLRVALGTALLFALGCLWAAHQRHVRDIHAGARACVSGWRTCRAYAGMENPISAVEDFGTPCGEGYQVCLEKIQEAAQ